MTSDPLVLEFDKALMGIAWTERLIFAMLKHKSTASMIWKPFPLK
jgi:hypothetical protein